ncbi:MAG: hypothetical protein E4H14_04520 [Candidatus Thorarchaeota archaeon]|nr:MAG: hypothetical protein E4H14_04520 [Candidatus Thorarchaeota archaeon]
MTEEKKEIRKKASKLTTIRNISPSIDGPVRVLGIVVNSSPGTALIQDLYDSDVDKAGSIWVSVEGTLELKKKYLIIGEVTTKTEKKSKEARLNATIVHDIDQLDIEMYKEILEMEDGVKKTMSG